MCVCFFASKWMRVGVDKGICFFSAIHRPTKAISITRETFRMKVSSYYNATASCRHIRALLFSFFFFSLTTPPCFLSEGLSLLWFIKRNSKYRGTWWIYVSWPHKQQVLYVMTMLTPCVCSDGQRNLHSILLWGISILLSSRVTWNSATVGWLLICICKQLWRASGSVSQYQQTKNLQYQNVNGVKAERQK